MKNLRPKHKAVIDKMYDEHKNATKAYQEVYQCSYDSARSASARLLNHNEIAKAYIKHRQEHRGHLNHIF